MAGGLLTTLPLVLAFLFFQKQFIAGITAGAIKQKHEARPSKMQTARQIFGGLIAFTLFLIEREV